MSARPIQLPQLEGKFKSFDSFLTPTVVNKTMVTKTITTNVETGIKEYALKVKSPNKSNMSGIHR